MVETALGVLDNMLHACDPAAQRDLVFMSVGIKYDRALEDRTRLQKLDSERARGPGWKRTRLFPGYTRSQAGRRKLQESE